MSISTGEVLTPFTHIIPLCETYFCIPLDINGRIRLCHTPTFQDNPLHMNMHIRIHMIRTNWCTITLLAWLQNSCLPRNYHNISTYYHAITTTLPWHYHNITTTLPRHYHVITTALPLHYHVIHHGSTTTLPRHYHGITMTLPQHYHHFTKTLPRH